MKILLDENIPQTVKFDPSADYQLYTVQKLGWKGKKNGELLGLLTLNSFTVLITLDKNLSKQQNLKKFPLTVFLLDAKDSRPKTIQPYIDKVQQNLKGEKNLKPGLLKIKIE